MSDLSPPSFLLARAARMYDARDSCLPAAGQRAITQGFTGGATWMRLAMQQVRGEIIPMHRLDAETLGWAKYGLSTMAALIPAFIAFITHLWPFALLVIPAFYAVEAQWVFLFPLAIDGDNHPMTRARILTARAGGTLSVMWTVLPIALFMLVGGFLGHGFVRAWCLGCLAIVLWYESVRVSV